MPTKKTASSLARPRTPTSRGTATPSILRAAAPKARAEEPAQKAKTRVGVTTPAAAPKPAAVVKEARKSTKVRPQLVRDSFTMPEADFALVAMLKSTALGARRAAKKSELLRAGLRALAGLDAQSLVAALDRLEAVKTGRPKKGH